MCIYIYICISGASIGARHSEDRAGGGEDAEGHQGDGCVNVCMYIYIYIYIYIYRSYGEPSLRTTRCRVRVPRSTNPRTKTRNTNV